MIKDWYEKKNLKAERVVYTAEFMIDPAFGLPGAITVINRHQREFFLESIVVEGFPSGPVHFPCNSWVQSTKDLPTKRIFFSNKVISLLATILNFSMRGYIRNYVRTYFKEFSEFEFM